MSTARQGERKQYYLADYETGEQTPVTKEVWERYNAWMQRMRADATPKLGDKYKGTPLLVGTAGGFDRTEGLKELFMTPASYGMGTDPCYKDSNECKLAVFFKPAYDQSYDVFGQPKEETNNQQYMNENTVDTTTPQRMMPLRDLPAEDRDKLHRNCVEGINAEIQQYKAAGAMKNAKDISDGYHTFGELYEVRAVLNIALFKKISWRIKYPERGAAAVPERMVWRSLLHSDGSMFEGMFIIGYGTEPGEQITFHYHLDKWNDCDFAQTLEKAPEWDGHTPADVLERLKHL